MKGVLHVISEDLGSAFHLDKADAWLPSGETIAQSFQASFAKHRSFERYLEVHRDNECSAA